MALLQFNAAEVEPSTPYEAIPAGWYNVKIADSSMEDTKSGNGEYLKLELEVLDGPHQGRKLFDRLNLKNPNAQAVEIAQRTLSSICHAVGLLKVNDSTELHGKPLQAKVKLGEYDGMPSNEVAGYKPAGGTQPAQAMPQTQQAIPDTNKPSWA